MAVCHVAGVTAEFTGDFVESNHLLERARELHDPAEHAAYTAMFGIDPGMVARAMSSASSVGTRLPGSSDCAERETIALGRSQRQPVTLVFALVVAQGILLYRGELAAAVKLGDEIIALCREYEFPQEAEWARGFQASAVAVKEAPNKASPSSAASLAALQALRSGLTRTMFLSLLG